MSLFKFPLAEFQAEHTEEKGGTCITVVPIPHKSYMCCLQLEGLADTADCSRDLIHDHDLLDILRGEPSASRRSSTKAHLTWKDDERIVIVLGFLCGMER